MPHPAMVCTANDLLEWKDFPKGLRVLLLDKDVTSASEIRSKLEQMDYIVSAFCNEDEASYAVLNKSKIFHVAIVEASTIDCDGSFKFLQLVKGMPTIMMASVQCLRTMMKCITLGAIEVLNKPICEDKLRGLWQHVVRKACDAGKSHIAESQLLVNESVFSSVKEEKPGNELIKEMSCISDNLLEDEYDCSSGNDKYLAPSRPQLKQAIRLLDDADRHDQTNWSTEKDRAEQCVESISVETTSCDTALDMPAEAGQPMCEGVIKQENVSADGSRSESNTSLHHNDQQDTGSISEKTRIQNKRSECPSPSGAKANKKKMKVDWTSDLHKKFLQAVEQLGADQAIPSRILELMNVEGLTRHNVASHLQKYRMHKRHSLPKREERKISARPKDTLLSDYYYHHKPIMAYPRPYHLNQTLLANQAYPMWGQPSNYSAGVQVLGPPYQPWPWKSCTAADAWGCPVMPLLHGSYSYPPHSSGYYGGEENGYSMTPSSSTDHEMADEVIHEIVKEAISKPWLPLPLGLKPPSTESVLSELSKQGISHIPPHSHRQ